MASVAVRLRLRCIISCF